MVYLQTQQEFNKSGRFKKMQNKFFKTCDEIKQEFGQMGADHAEAYLTEMFGEPL